MNPPTLTVAAEARNASKIYGSGDTRVTALDGVDVEIAAQQFTAIMGPSGSGKSTLMHCLAGLDSVTSGEVWIGDTELSSLSDKALTRLRRDSVGFVFQAFNLVPTLTALENITLPMDMNMSLTTAMSLSEKHSHSDITDMPSCASAGVFGMVRTIA